MKACGLLSYIDNSLQHFRNYVSLGKALADQKHFCFMNLLGTVIKTQNIILALTFSLVLYSESNPLLSDGYLFILESSNH